MRQNFTDKGIGAKRLRNCKERLKAWEHTYNYVRPHQALSYLTPMEFYALWKENKARAYEITKKYQTYLIGQRETACECEAYKKTRTDRGAYAIY